MEYDGHGKRAEMGNVCSGLGSLLEGGPLEGGHIEVNSAVKIPMSESHESPVNSSALLLSLLDPPPIDTAPYGIVIFCLQHGFCFCAAVGLACCSLSFS